MKAEMSKISHRRKKIKIKKKNEKAYSSSDLAKELLLLSQSKADFFW